MKIKGHNGHLTTKRKELNMFFPPLKCPPWILDRQHNDYGGHGGHLGFWINKKNNRITSSHQASFSSIFTWDLRSSKCENVRHDDRQSMMAIYM